MERRELSEQDGDAGIELILCAGKEDLYLDFLLDTFALYYSINCIPCAQPGIG